MNPISDAVTDVAELGVLHCAGPDTLHFLQGQLTQDFALLRHDTARLAAFLSAKGRMQASFIAVRHGATDVLLLTHASVLAAVQKRLSMFILRAKVTLTDATGDWQVQGLLGSAVERIAGQPLAPWQVIADGSARGETDAPPGSVESAKSARWTIGLYPADGVPRALRITARGAAAEPVGAPAGLWAWTEVRAGIATISAPAVDLFVPQMLNYESVDGISFKKGCYPGQEVVARSQFRGAIKRRAYLASGQAAALPAAGSEVFAADDPEQPCGVIAEAAWAPGDSAAPTAARFDAIVSLKTDHAAQPLLVSVDGSPVALTAAPPPYRLRDDI